ncbi:MAG: amidohydrolase family protein [Candidatus Methanomethyliaceae archaeon]
MIDGCLAVDVHCHLAPLRQGYYGLLGQTPEQLLARMEKTGIDHAVVFPMVNNAGLTPDDIKRANDYIIEAVYKYPRRLTGFCLLTPMHGEKALEEMERCVKAGLKGIKLHPHIHGNYPIDGEIMKPVMERAKEYHMIVLTHSDVNSKRCSPYQVVRLAQAYPDVPVIMAHMGMDSDFTHFVPDLVRGIPNLFVDTSDTPNLPEFVYARPSRVIPNQILFGSDMPTLSVEVELCKLRVAEELYGIDSDGKRKLLGENAARLLGL